MTPESTDALRRLKQLFRLFAVNCLKIKDKGGSIVPLVLNRAQLYIHERIEKQLAETGRVRALILKGRQQGASTYTEARLFWRTVLNTGKSAYILTHEDKATQNIFGMARRYHELMPAVMRPKTSAANANELVFSAIQSKYMVGTAGSRGTGRSSTVQYFHGSEVAFWPNAKDHLAGVGQAVPDLPGTEVILESTANGIGNTFHTMVMQAMRGVGDFQLIFVPWFWQPEYARDAEGFEAEPDEVEYQQTHDLTNEQMAWRRAKIATDFQGDIDLFNQEYPATVALAFQASTTGSYLSLGMIERAMSTVVTDVGGAPKIMGVDPGEYGEDPTVIARRQGRKVLPLEMHHKRGPMEVVGLVARAADDWKPDAINVDCTGIGSGIADRLTELGYPVNRVHNGSRAIDDKQYSRRLEEQHGEWKKWLEDEPNELPDDEALKMDAVSRRYSYDSSRRLVMESKETMKKRGLPSPNCSDSVALTFAERIAVAVKREPRPAPNWRTA
jgi:hypothetical protein